MEWRTVVLPSRPLGFTTALSNKTQQISPASVNTCRIDYVEKGAQNYLFRKAIGCIERLRRPVRVHPHHPRQRRHRHRQGVDIGRRTVLLVLSRPFGFATATLRATLVFGNGWRVVGTYSSFRKKRQCTTFDRIIKTSTITFLLYRQTWYFLSSFFARK